MEAIARLVAQGRMLRDALNDPSNDVIPGSIAVWQRDCAALVSELSGGVKAHWLSRAFSEALLVKAGHVDVPVVAIVERIMTVLEQANAAIAQAGGLVSVPEGSAPASPLFAFVHDAALRPVLEQAYVASRDALDDRRFDDALRTTCGILEAILSDALATKGVSVSSWTFEARIEAAKRERLIRGGCARLPQVARTYRDAPEMVVTERDARIAGQVLRIVMRDLDPGR